MAETDLTYSADVARKAARYFFWHRCLTRFGLALIASNLILMVFCIVIVRYAGAIWVVGLCGCLVALNVASQVGTAMTMPRALARSISDLKSREGRLTTDDEGLVLSLDGNVVKVPWTKVRYVWVRDQFITLGMSYFTMLHLPTEDMTPIVRAEFERRASRQVGA